MTNATKTKTMKHRDLGPTIARARAARHLRRDSLAAKAGVSKEIIQKLEYGSSDNPRLSTIRKIAKALGMPLADLLPQDDWPRRSVEEYLEDTALERINRTQRSRFD